MTQQSLVSLIDQRLESGEVELPVFDTVALRVHREARENKLDVEGMCRLLEKDPALVGEVMRMANSSFFRGLSEVSSLREATVRLGVKQIAALAMSVGQKRLYSSSKGPFKARLIRLWQHSAAVSRGARWVAMNTGHRKLSDEAFVAGLLHDVGKMSLLRIIEDIARGGGVRLTNDLVNAALEKLSSEHGARLMATWNLPESLQTVALHMIDKELDESNTLLCIVRLVDQACALEGISDRPDESIVLEALPERRALGLSELDIAELRLMLEDMRGSSRKAA